MYIDRICIPCLHVGRTYFKPHQRATDARESTTKGLDIRRRSIIFSRIAPIEPRVSTLIDFSFHALRELAFHIPHYSHLRSDKRFPHKIIIIKATYHERDSCQSIERGPESTDPAVLCLGTACR